jgi:hypothetical protein
MDHGFDEQFRLWIEQVAFDWRVSVDEALGLLGAAEARNRASTYPALAAELVSPSPDMSAIRTCASRCWPLCESSYLTMRIADFAGHPDSSQALAQFLSALPDDDIAAGKYISEFVEQLLHLGFAKDGKPKRDMAALVVSAMLSALQPDRFVDFRDLRWRWFACELGRAFPSPNSSYGERLIAAGRLASDVTRTATFRKAPTVEPPTWRVAGMCWQAHKNLWPDEVSMPPAVDGEYDEGQLRLYLHYRRERNAAVVNAAKERWKAADPLLRCEACGFSFVERYGDVGADFIEAHHTIPLASLHTGARTRVEDLARVCANCHRMLHQGGGTTVGDLRQLIRGAGAEFETASRAAQRTPGGDLGSTSLHTDHVPSFDSGG